MATPQQITKLPRESIEQAYVRTRPEQFTSQPTVQEVRSGESVAQARIRETGPINQPAPQQVNIATLPSGQQVPVSSGVAAKIAQGQAQERAQQQAMLNNKNLIISQITEQQYASQRQAEIAKRYESYGQTPQRAAEIAKGQYAAERQGESYGKAGAMTDIKLAHTAADAAIQSAEAKQSFMYPAAKSYYSVEEKNPQIYEKGATDVQRPLGADLGLNNLNATNKSLYNINNPANVPTNQPNASTNAMNTVSDSSLKSFLEPKLAWWREGVEKTFTPREENAPAWVRFGLSSGKAGAETLALPFSFLASPKETAVGLYEGFVGLPKAAFKNPIETAGSIAGGSIIAGGMLSTVGKFAPKVRVSEAKITGEAPKTGMFEMAEAADTSAKPTIVAPKGYEVKPNVETITPTKGNVIGGIKSYQYFPDTAPITAAPLTGLMTSFAGSIGKGLGKGKGLDKGNAPVNMGGVSSRVLEGTPPAPSSVSVKPGKGFGTLNIDMRAVKEATAAEATPIIGPDGKYYYKAKAPTDETGAPIDVSKLAEVNAAAANYAGLKAMAQSAPETPWRGAYLQFGSGQGGRGVYPLVGLSGDTVVLGSKLPEGALSGLEKSLGGYEGMKVEGPLELKLIKENIISKYPEAERANIERTFDIRSSNFGQKSNTIAPELPIKSVLELHELKPETIKNVKSWFDEQSLAYKDTGNIIGGSTAQSAQTGYLKEGSLVGRPFRNPHDVDFYIKDSGAKSKELMSIIDKTEPKGTVWFKKEGSPVIESKKGTIFDIHDIEKPLESDISSSLTSTNKEGYLAFGYKAEAPVKVGNTYAVSLSEQATRKIQGAYRLRTKEAAPAEHRFKDLPDLFSAEMKATESRGAVKSLLKPKETTKTQIMETEKFWTGKVLTQKPEVQAEYFQKLKANMPESIARIKAEQPELYEKFKLGEPVKEMPKTEEGGMFLYSKKLKAETGAPSFRTVAVSSSSPSAERKSATKRSVLDTGSISSRGNLYTGSVRSSGYSRARNVLSTGSISSGFKSPSPKKSPYSGMSSGGSSYTSPKSSPSSYSPARSVLSTGSISPSPSPRSSSPRSPYSYKSPSSSRSPYRSPSSYSVREIMPKSPIVSRPYGNGESKKSDLIDVFKEKKGGRKEPGLAIHPRADPLSRMISEIKTGKTAEDPLPTKANAMKFMREVTRGGQIFQTRGGAEKGGLLPPIRNILGRAKGKKGGFW